MKIIEEKLFALRDPKYKEFQAKLIPTVNPQSVIGVRTPQLRALARELRSADFIKDFLDELPHTYFEENNLHGFIIEQILDFDEGIAAINEFLPFVDNWATCDQMRPKCFKKNTERLLTFIENWLNSSHTYTVRFGIEMLMTFYLDDNFRVEHLDRVARIQSDEYYINMMIAWYFATALAKQWQSAVPFVEQNKLPKWVHNKTIQKAVESYRITDEQKVYLRKFRLK